MQLMTGLHMRILLVLAILASSVAGTRAISYKKMEYAAQAVKFDCAGLVSNSNSNSSI